MYDSPQPKYELFHSSQSATPLFCKNRSRIGSTAGWSAFLSDVGQLPKGDPKKSGIGTRQIMGVQGWNLSVQNRFPLSSAQQKAGTKSPSVRRTVSSGLCWQPGEVVQSGIPEEVPGMNPYYAVFLHCALLTIMSDGFLSVYHNGWGWTREVKKTAEYITIFTRSCAD